MLLVIKGQVGTTLACGTGRFADLGPVVFDTQTNLMWEKKVTGSGCLHCVDDTYTWCQATGIDTGCSVSPPSWIEQMNIEQFFGYDDWRLPIGTDGQFGEDQRELATILLEPFPCFTHPCIDPIFGPTASNNYWTRTELDPIKAWFVRFEAGDVGTTFKTVPHRVRAVRSVR
jgi:hypothetical protein